MADKPSIIVHGFKVVFTRDPATGRRDRPVEYVMYSPSHSAMFSTIEERVEWLKPENFKAREDDDNSSMKRSFMQHRWAMIEPHYNAWKEGRTIDVPGTPLSQWPALDEYQVAEFAKFHVKTVEQLAEMAEAVMGRVQVPGIRTLREEAKVYLENTDRGALAAQVAEQQATMEQMGENLAAAMALIEELQAEKEAAPKRRRDAAA